jgi:hypothetical protein
MTPEEIGDNLQDSGATEGTGRREASGRERNGVFLMWEPAAARPPIGSAP